MKHAWVLVLALTACSKKKEQEGSKVGIGCSSTGAAASAAMSASVITSKWSTLAALLATAACMAPMLVNWFTWTLAGKPRRAPASITRTISGTVK